MRAWTRLGRGLPIAAVLCAVAAAPPGPAWAARWQVLDWNAPGRLRQVALVPWKGQPVILATAGGKGADKKDFTQLTLLRLGDSQVTEVAAWQVPGPLRWVEPMRTAPGQGQWLGLRADGWHLGRADGSALEWRRICTCASVFGKKEEPDAWATSFTQDMNGDGVDALVLPDLEGLTVYRWLADAGVMEPLWRYRWAAPLLRDPEDEDEWELPTYWLLDTSRTGLLDLVIHSADHLAVYRHPRLAPPRYVLNSAARVRLESVSLPPGMASALTALGDAAYTDAQRLVAALAYPTDPKLRAEWLAAFPDALWAMQVDPRVVEPEVLPLPGAPKLHAGDYTFPVALADLTGDGVPDLLQSAVLTDSSALGRRGEMRLYMGTVRDGRWSVARTEKPITMGGAAVAELVRIAPRADAAPALLVASTDVTLSTILRSLSSGTVKLDLHVHVLQQGQFPPKPTQRAQLSVEDINTVGRPLVLAADLDGDGWRELLIHNRPQRMAVYPGSAAGPRIGTNPLPELRSAVPRKPQEAFIADLDGSGRESLAFWYRSGKYTHAQRRQLRFARLRD